MKPADRPADVEIVARSVDSQHDPHRNEYFIALSYHLDLMSSLFKKIKDSLGGKSSQSKGHVLGTRQQSPSSSASNDQGANKSSSPKTIEVCFEAQTLGMQIESASGGLPVVKTVYPETAAESKGVLAGDIVIAVDNAEISSFDQCMHFLRGTERPINIR